MVLKPARVELHIEELVLHGVPATEQERVSRALAAELTRLLVEEGTPSSWRRPRAIASIQTEPLEVQGIHSPEELGVRVARSLYGGLGR